MIDILKVLTIIVFLFVVMLLFQFNHYKKQIIFIAGVMIAASLGIYFWEIWSELLAASAFLLILWFLFQKAYIKFYWYQYPGMQTEFFDKQKVLVFVPHQDDEINLTSDILEKYIAAQSEIYVVYATNGDYGGFAEKRMREAIQVCQEIGIKKEHIIFLGYGDQWERGHIYNANKDSVLTSHAGFDKTYALEEHQAFRPDRSYTREHYLDDIKAVIELYLPDVIFAVDYDVHVDHRAAGLLFDEAIGLILKSNREYHPKIYKGFCYSTAYYGKEDFEDSVNIGSTIQIEKTPYMSENGFYSWNKRVRIPIETSNLSRNLRKCKSYKLLSMYTTQPTLEKAPRIINGDKVFWERRTDSVFYDAKIVDIHGRTQSVNNFKLLESKNILEKDGSPYCSGWFPSKTDLEQGKAELTVKFSQKRALSGLRVYGNPACKGEILNLEIKFDNGRIINTGRIERESFFEFVPIDCAALSIKITDYNGFDLGIAEIEGYSIVKKPQVKFLKIMDENKNFVYDLLGEKNEYVFEVYSYPQKPETDLSEFVEVSLNNPKCKYLIKQNRIFFQCPKNQRCEITVRAKENENVSDTILVQQVSKCKCRLISYTIRHSFFDIVLYYKKMASQLVCYFFKQRKKVH